MSRERAKNKGSSGSFTWNPNSSAAAFEEAEYISRLTGWCLARFDWTNLPSSCDERNLELGLFNDGLMVFYYDHRYGEFLCVQAMQSGEFDHNRNPLYYQTLAIGNYQTVKLSREECVPIWNNRLRLPTFPTVMRYAHRLMNLDLSLQVTALQFRHPYIITCDEASRLSFSNLFNQVEEGVPAILGSKALDTANIQVLQTGVNPQSLAALRVERTHLWAECLTALGIAHSESEKRERLVAAEAMGKVGSTVAARQDFLTPRLEAVKEINEKWNLKLSVEWKMDEVFIPDLVEGGLYG